MGGFGISTLGDARKWPKALSTFTNSETNLTLNMHLEDTEILGNVSQFFNDNLKMNTVLLVCLL